LRDVAAELADYLLEARTSEGGVAHWKQYGAERGPAIVFDTGQVVFGWLSAWRQTGREAYLDAAVAAGDWLVRVQDPSGAWVQNQHLGTLKTIDTRVAWALLELARATSAKLYVAAARRNLDWALGQQQACGWFRHAAFRAGADPDTHALAYTVEGLLESGLLLDEPPYVAAAVKAARALLRCQRPDGSLASTYSSSWRPISRSSCLTGNCQMARLWLRLYHLGGEEAFLSGARQAIAFVARTQDLESSNPNVRGGISGSFPIYGRYERFKYLSWAAKFFIDALLALAGVPDNRSGENTKRRTNGDEHRNDGGTL
jgi:uncharacterized protein YyaL (SSP411 family)